MRLPGTTLVELARLNFLARTKTIRFDSLGRFRRCCRRWFTPERKLYFMTLRCSRRSTLVVTLMLVLLFVIGSTSPASGITWQRWYAGNWKSTSYGGKASIGAPNGTPYLAHEPFAFVAAWVGPWQGSGDTMRWVQSGWSQDRDANGDMLPLRSYYEYRRSYEDAIIVWRSNQAYGTARLYDIQYNGTSGLNFVWKIYISGGYQATIYSDLQPPNARIDAKSESTYSGNQVLAEFVGVQYRNSSGQYYNFFTDNRIQDNPFYLTWVNTHQYTAHGNGM